ncbi:hypothetical protein NUU61_001253 [Penicillium alfredii]|uniref:LIM zinc-binding domain-containing protein n=1 Tax=Penicillium alfredii TaxID=1506179 RepID=A0A9W9GB59_9EURO|nr:uncharacterized protein NUU61_001253 [Penicillium alfredii]KAJ5115494.1 hypothetical protein NUU61_001253 [Penicillium alfredii]
MASMMGMLPSIKCSNCGCDVEISVMGDHVPRCAHSIAAPSAGFESPDHLTSKSGRPGAPPRIDPSIANRAFLQPNVPTPASSVGSHVPSPHSIASAPRSPRPHQAEDDSDVINLDSVLSFPMPGNRSPARFGTPGPMGEGTTPRSMPPAPSPRLGLDQVPENVQLPPSPLPPPPEPGYSHHRSDSVASHSSYRTSFASTRYASSTGRSSTNSLSRGLRTFMDDTPPVPPAPLRTPHKGSFSRDSNLSVSSSYRSDRGDTYSGFDFGIPTDRHSGLHDLPEEHSVDSPRSNGQTQDFQRSPRTHLHPAAADSISYARRKNSDATSDSGLSVTSFARALGLEDHVNKADSSTASSDSSPSETRSGSSMSSLPSDASLHRHKAIDPLNLGPLVEELPPRTRQTILEIPGRVRSTMDEVPPIPAAFFSPDSPTDPSINQGGLSLISEKPEKRAEIARKEVPSPNPQRPRAPTSPIPRPPTRSNTLSSTGRSKGRCKGCNEEITGKSISSSDGRLTGRYHRGCFVCFECHSPFQTADFYVLNNRPFCAQHYHERNGSLCSTCHNGIEGHYLETVEQNRGRSDRRRFHPECLQCRACRVLLKGDYFEWNGEVFCERDARRAAAAYYPPPPGRRRPTLGSSPLSQSREFTPGAHPPPSPGPGAGGLRPGPRFPSGGARRFPERRTTKLMMV